jgi:hypothetical protein
MVTLVSFPVTGTVVPAPPAGTVVAPVPPGAGAAAVPVADSVLALGAHPVKATARIIRKVRSVRLMVFLLIKFGYIASYYHWRFHPWIKNA